jgi:hypothetical protein
MSTPIYKVSDGSTITFKKRGPELYAVLSTPSGQVINGPSRMGNNEASAAREIMLANNITDPNTGEPLTYTIEGSQDSSIENAKGNNYVYSFPRTTLSEVADETALNNAKTNKEILTQDNEALNKALEPELPPEVRFTNFVNSQKSTIKKRLIPFVIGLITPFAPQVVPLIISNLGINGDTTVDSLKDSAKAKADEAKAKADEAKAATNDIKNKAKDEEALKAAAAGAGAFILGKITKDQIIGLIDCPSSSKIQSAIKQRNLLVTQINGMYKNIDSLTKVLGITTVSMSVIQQAIKLAKSNPYPATGIPPLGLPPLTSGIQTTIASFVAKLEKTIDKTQPTLTVITITITSFATFLGIILKFLNMLDIILEYCAEDKTIDFEAINDEINALANPTVIATQNDNTNTYKGFTLGVKIDEKNESKYIRRYAVAQNKQGVDVLRTDSSFASDPAVLISQLKFIIDTNLNITAE